MILVLTSFLNFKINIFTFSSAVYRYSYRRLLASDVNIVKIRKTTETCKWICYFEWISCFLFTQLKVNLWYKFLNLNCCEQHKNYLRNKGKQHVPKRSPLFWLWLSKQSRSVCWDPGKWPLKWQSSQQYLWCHVYWIQWHLLSLTDC